MPPAFLSPRALPLRTVSPTLPPSTFLSTRAPLRLSISPPRSRLSVHMSAPKVSVGDVPACVGAAVLTAAESAIASRGRFVVAISGGSLPKLLAAGLQGKEPDLSTWHVYLADERVVPLDHPDSNYNLVKQHLPDMNLVPIDPQLGVDECARDYHRKLVSGLGEGLVFDAVLLGLGPDGHTCSLFPGHELLEEREQMVAAISDSPKPPPERVTLTLPVLNRARAAMFVCTGEGKAGVVKDCLESKESKLPGSLVKPNGDLHWFLDEAAAGQLSS